MNWEAFFIIGLLALITGSVLYITTIFFVRRRLKKHPDADASLKVTNFGFLFLSIMLLTLFGGYSFQYFLPDTLFGQYMKTALGRLVFSLVTIILFIYIEKIFKTKGYSILHDNGNRSV